MRNKERLHAIHVDTLKARIDHPRASLTEIAGLRGATKHAYAGALRRAFIYADRVKYTERATNTR